MGLEQALELAGRHKIYAYDAYVIACALNEDCGLLTLDGGLSHTAKVVGVDIVEVR